MGLAVALGFHEMAEAGVEQGGKLGLESFKGMERGFEFFRPSGLF